MTKTKKPVVYVVEKVDANKPHNADLEDLKLAQDKARTLHTIFPTGEYQVAIYERKGVVK